MKRSQKSWSKLQSSTNKLPSTTSYSMIQNLPSWTSSASSHTSSSTIFKGPSSSTAVPSVSITRGSQSTTGISRDQHIRKRHKTPFSEAQIIKLGESFIANERLTPAMLLHLSETLNLDPCEIESWFKNRWIEEYYTGPKKYWGPSKYSVDKNGSPVLPPPRTVATPTSRILPGQVASRTICAHCGYFADHSIPVPPLAGHRSNAVVNCNDKADRCGGTNITADSDTTPAGHANGGASSARDSGTHVVGTNDNSAGGRARVARIGRYSRTGAVLVPAATAKGAAVPSDDGATTCKSARLRKPVHAKPTFRDLVDHLPYRIVVSSLSSRNKRHRYHLQTVDSHDTDDSD